MSTKAKKHRFRTLLDEQKQKVFADCQARISQYEFQAAQAEEEQRLLQGLLWQEKLEFRDAHQPSLTSL